MSVLIGKEIQRALKENLICIERLEKSQIGPGSIMVRKDKLPFCPGPSRPAFPPASE